MGYDFFLPHLPCYTRVWLPLQVHGLGEGLAEGVGGHLLEEQVVQTLLSDLALQAVTGVMDSKKPLLDLDSDDAWLLLLHKREHLRGQAQTVLQGRVELMLLWLDKKEN